MVGNVDIDCFFVNHLPLFLSCTLDTTCNKILMILLAMLILAVCFFPGRFPSLFILHFWHHTWHDDVVAVGNVEIDCLLTFFIGRVFFLLHPGHHAYRDVSDVVDNVDIDYLMTFFLGCISSLSHTLHTTLVMMLVMLLGVRLSLDTEQTRSGCPWDGKLGLLLGCW